MTVYRYTFDHGARKESCPACGHRTWRTLVSTRTGEPCDPIYGVREDDPQLDDWSLALHIAMPFE